MNYTHGGGKLVVVVEGGELIITRYFQSPRAILVLNEDIRLRKRKYMTVEVLVVEKEGKLELMLGGYDMI